jgi:hypothetical protein
MGGEPSSTATCGRRPDACQARLSPNQPRSGPTSLAAAELVPTSTTALPVGSSPTCPATHCPGLRSSGSPLQPQRQAHPPCVDRHHRARRRSPAAQSPATIVHHCRDKEPPISSTCAQVKVSPPPLAAHSVGRGEEGQLTCTQANINIIQKNINGF